MRPESLELESKSRTAVTQSILQKLKVNSSPNTLGMFEIFYFVWKNRIVSRQIYFHSFQRNRQCSCRRKCSWRCDSWWSTGLVGLWTKFWSIFIENRSTSGWSIIWWQNDYNMCGRSDCKRYKLVFINDCRSKVSIRRISVFIFGTRVTHCSSDWCCWQSHKLLFH